MKYVSTLLLSFALDRPGRRSVPSARTATAVLATFAAPAVAVAAALALLLAPAPPLAAQDPARWDEAVRETDLPPQFREEMVRIFEAEGTRQIQGPSTIPPDEDVPGDVAATGGGLFVEGYVDGSIAAVDGDVEVGPDAHVAGDIIVVGGEVRLDPDASVGGTVVSHQSQRERPRYARREYPGLDEGHRPWQDHHLESDGGARFSLRAGPTYNRVEGLPVMFGPGVRTGGSYPLQIEALGIWRTGASESRGTERFGYRVRAEQYLDPRGRWTFGGSAYSVVQPIDDWRVGDLETSLAAVGFREDYRDHFEREGWSGFVSARPLRPLELRVEYRDAEHGSVAAGDPWSLFNGSDTWRAEPIVAEGAYRSLRGSLEIDTRGQTRDRHEHRDLDPRWLARISVERGLGGELVVPAILVGPSAGMDEGSEGADELLRPAHEFSTDLTTAFIDLRQYSPVTRSSSLDLRVVAGGNLSADPLPPQFQHALGGIGTLPGYPLFAADCGARSAVGSVDGVSFFPGFGCDRFILGQIQLRGPFGLDLGFGSPWNDRDRGDSGGGLGSGWTVFLDAARGWAYPAEGSTARVSTETLYDAGFGLRIEDLGLFFALPLSEGVERDWRFVLRLGPRF